MFKRIDHVEIVTARQDETVAFYTDVLGFREKARDRIQRPDGTALNLGSNPIDQGKRCGSAHLSAPVVRNRCGIFFWFR